MENHEIPDKLMGTLLMLCLLAQLFIISSLKKAAVRGDLGSRSSSMLMSARESDH